MRKGDRGQKKTPKAISENNRAPCHSLDDQEPSKLNKVRQELRRWDNSVAGGGGGRNLWS